MGREMYRFGGDERQLYSVLRDEAEAAARLSEDLTRLALGLPLCEKAIETAPFFERYFFVTQPKIVCMGHLRVRMGEDPILTHTNEVIVDAAREGWIRTRDTLFRVGQQFRSPIQW